MPKLVVVPLTAIRPPSREPVMKIVGFADARGTTAFEGLDAADQPAPVSALTAKVYAVPLVNPATSQFRAGAVTRHVCAPGVDMAR